MGVHEKIESLVDAYVAGAMDLKERRETDEHAGACTSCATALADADGFAKWVKGAVGADAPPAGIEERIIARFRKETAPKRKAWRFDLPPRATKWIATIAALLLLTIVGGVFTNGTRDAGSAPQSVSTRGFTGDGPLTERSTGLTLAGIVDAGTVDEYYTLGGEKFGTAVRKVEAPKTREYAPDKPAADTRANLKRLADLVEELDSSLENSNDGKKDQSQPQDPVNPFANRKLIFNGTLHLEIEAYEAAYTKINEIVNAQKGFISTADTQKLANGKIRATVVVRVPPERFDAALAALRPLGTVRNQAISTQDVTKAYVDLESRLKSKETLVERLKKILLEGKGTVKELMEVEVQMGKTIEEIEAIKGELKYYDNLVGMSTITVHLFEKDLGQPFEYVQTLQSNIGLTTRDIDAAYAAAQKVIADAGGQVADCKMQRQSEFEATAFVRGRVDAAKFPAVREALKKLGHVDSDTVDQQQTARGGDGAAKPDAPVKKEQAVIDLTIALPGIARTRTAQIVIEIPDAQGAYEAARKAIEAAGGKVDGTYSGRVDGQTGTVTGEVDADRFQTLVDALKALGKVKSATVNTVLPPSASSGTTKILRERGSVHVTVTTPPALIAEEHGIGRTIRDTFSNSFAGLMWSIEKLFVGLSLAGPWIALVAIVVLAVRRWRAKKAAAQPPVANS